MNVIQGHKTVIIQRKKREKQHRIQSILDAAQKVFFTRGFVKATMDEIAYEAELSKPTIYRYFKTKDELFFSLMLPVLEDLGTMSQILKKNLEENRYCSGDHFVRDLFHSCYRSYKKSPDIFRIVQLFQQSGLVWMLDTEFQMEMNKKGKSNFELLREVIQLAMEQGLIKRMNVFQLTDILWGLFVGIIQLDGIKSQSKQEDVHLQPTLKLAEELVVEAIALKRA